MTDASDSETRPFVAALVRDERSRLLAALAADFHDLQLAEDALSDAIVQALQSWPREGRPRNPLAWLLTVARRRAIDRLRHERQKDGKRIEIEMLAEDREVFPAVDRDDAIPDERLRLIFTCCHPALRQSAQVALTLKTLCGLHTDEIARAFLVAETTMGQRIVRAKKKIRDAGIPYRVPDPAQFADRLDSVLAVIYLIFTEGWSATRGDSPVRLSLCEEAMQLGAVLDALLPANAEILGLRALMYLHAARLPARCDDAGDIVTLDRQDRSRWDSGLQASGRALLERAVRTGEAGPYVLQAMISAEHSMASAYADTNWARICALYDALRTIQPTPVVALNATVARFLSGSREAALAELDALADQPGMDSYQPYFATRAELLRQAGRYDEARTAGERALALSGNAAERRFMEARLRQIAAGA